MYSRQAGANHCTYLDLWARELWAQNHEHKMDIPFGHESGVFVFSCLILQSIDGDTWIVTWMNLRSRTLIMAIPPHRIKWQKKRHTHTHPRKCSGKWSKMTSVDRSLRHHVKTECLRIFRPHQTLKQRQRSTRAGNGADGDIRQIQYYRSRYIIKLGWWKTPISICHFYFFFIFIYCHRNRHTHFISPDDGNFHNCVYTIHTHTHTPRREDIDSAAFGTCMNGTGSGTHQFGTYRNTDSILMCRFAHNPPNMLMMCLWIWNDSIRNGSQLLDAQWAKTYTSYSLPAFFHIYSFPLMPTKSYMPVAGSNILVGWFLGIRRMEWIQAAE